MAVKPAASRNPALQLRQFRKSDSELAEKKPYEGAESESAETIEDAGVVLRLLRRRHDIDRRLCGRVAFVFGH